MPVPPIIVPTILVPTFAEFAEQHAKFTGLIDYVQIDVMDGKFVNNTSFQDIEKINSLDDALKYELHLMVNEPLRELKRWTKIKNVFRALFPIESAADPDACINFIRAQGWEAGIVLNPDTPLQAAKPYLDKIDVLQFMTVYPGRQGQPFVESVKEKIKQFSLLPNHPRCAVDGAIRVTNIPELKKFGVEIFYVGSALIKAPDVKVAYEELHNALI